MKRILLIVGMAWSIVGCSSTPHVSNVVLPIPEKCGIYTIHYEKADSNSSIVKYDKSIYETYRNKVLLYGVNIWTQTIGGLLYPDGRDTGSYTLTHTDVNLIEVIKDGHIDRENLKKECDKLKHR